MSPPSSPYRCGFPSNFIGIRSLFTNSECRICYNATMSDEELGAIPTDWLERARSRLTPEDWDAIVDAAILKAKDGDRYARDFIVAFRLPKDFSAQEANTAKEVRLVLRKENAEKSE